MCKVDKMVELYDARDYCATQFVWIDPSYMMYEIYLWLHDAYPEKDMESLLEESYNMAKEIKNLYNVLDHTYCTEIYRYEHLFAFI